MIVELSRWTDHAPERRRRAALRHFSLIRFAQLAPGAEEGRFLEIARTARPHLGLARSEVAFRLPPRRICLIVGSKCGDSLTDRFDDKLGLWVVCVGHHHLHPIAWAIRTGS
jgi:hypothetical protein